MNIIRTDDYWFWDKALKKHPKCGVWMERIARPKLYFLLRGIRPIDIGSYYAPG